MKLKLNVIIVLFFYTNLSFSQQVDDKFPLNKIQIKIKKPGNYYLLTPENLKELKNKLFNIIDVCSESKTALDNTLNNPNYQVLINETNYNEIITFSRIAKFPINKNLPELLQKKLKEHCYTFKNVEIENLSMNSGVSQIGNYVSFLNKIITPEITYYSEGYFFETRNSTIILTINNAVKITNTNFVNSFDYINNEQYENLLDDFTKLIRKKDIVNAKAKLLEAIMKEPENVVAYEKRASLNLILKDFSAVMADANSILKIDTMNINGHLIKGLALYNQKKYEGAITCFKEAIFYFSLFTLANTQNEYVSTFAEMYRLIGESYVKLNNASSATENFEHALELSYDSLNTASIYFNLGYAQSSLLRNSAEAIKFYSKAIQNYPISAEKEKSEAYYNRGLNKRYIDDLNDAISDYNLAIQIRPDYVKAICNRGYAKLLLEDYISAIADFTMTIKYDNNATESSSMAFGNRGIAKLSLQQDGCPDIKKAIDLGNKNMSKFYIEYCD